MIWLFVIVFLATLVAKVAFRQHQIRSSTCPMCGERVEVYDVSDTEVLTSHDKPECEWFVRAMELSRSKDEQ